MFRIVPYVNAIVEIGTKTTKKMGTFCKKFNPVTGKCEWAIQPEDYDYIQEIARSSYADMLHDTERNKKYYAAIKSAVDSVKRKGKLAKVLDIGTGTGLLSLMAVHSGADSVVACEAFYPVAQCAMQVIKDNECDGMIKVISKRSTELIVGPGQDLSEKANILVAEVFDTELIGEGALGTFSHALNFLLEDDAIVVPSSAIVYAQLVQSEMMKKWNNIYPVKVDENNIIYPPEHIKYCAGAAAVHDLQLSQLSTKDFIPISQPIEIFRFDFTDKTKLKMDEEKKTQITSLTSAQCQIVFMWWQLQMDVEEKIILSCAPYWTHPTPLSIPWRDHWIQAAYYFPTHINVKKGEKIDLYSYHDEYSLWFNICRSEESERCMPISRPVCTCGIHIAFSRTRLAMLNDSTANQSYIKALKRAITPESRCLCISDGSLLPLMAALLGAQKVYTVETQQQNKLIESYVKSNAISDRVVVIKKNIADLTMEDIEEKKVDLLIGEPYFTTSILPWDNLHFWYVCSLFKSLLSPSAVILPGKATIKGVAVEFKELHKIRAPVGTAEGFDLSTFDEMIKKAIEMTDSPIEPHPLWEYPCIALSPCFEMMTFDLMQTVGNTIHKKSGCIDLSSFGTCNGIAMWMEYQMDNTTSISTGPMEATKLGKTIKWNMTTRQGVHFLNEPISIQHTSADLKYSVLFDPVNGHLSFTFNSVS